MLARRRPVLPGTMATQNGMYDVGSQRINVAYAQKEALASLKVKDFKSLYTKVSGPTYAHLASTAGPTIQGHTSRDPAQRPANKYLQLLDGMPSFTLNEAAAKRQIEYYAGNPSEVALPVHTNLNVIKARIKPEGELTSEKGRRIDDLNAVLAQRSIRFSGIITSPDGRADSNGHRTTSHVSGPRTVKNRPR